MTRRGRSTPLSWTSHSIKLKDMLLTATPGTDQTLAALPEEKTDEDEAPDAQKEE